MKTPLAAWENTWTTSLGAYFPGERVVLRGRDLFTELKDLSWIGLLIYGITGNIPDQKSVRLLNGIWTLATSYPDPRIWNNRIGALAGTARSTATLGVSAGIDDEAVVTHRKFELDSVLDQDQRWLRIGRRIGIVLNKEEVERARRVRKETIASFIVTDDDDIHKK